MNSDSIRSTEKTFCGRALIAEDNVSYRVILEKIVRDCRIKYDSVSDGKAAWTLMANMYEMYNVLLLDIMMPHFTGLQLLDISDKVMPKESVLIVTGDKLHDPELDEARKQTIMLHPSVYGIIEKPFEDKQIVSVLADIITRVDNVRRRVEV